MLELLSEDRGIPSVSLAAPAARVAAAPAELATLAALSFIAPSKLPKLGAASLPERDALEWLRDEVERPKDDATLGLLVCSFLLRDAVTAAMRPACSAGAGIVGKRGSPTLTYQKHAHCLEICDQTNGLTCQKYLELKRLRSCSY